MLDSDGLGKRSQPRERIFCDGMIQCILLAGNFLGCSAVHRNNPLDPFEFVSAWDRPEVYIEEFDLESEEQLIGQRVRQFYRWWKSKCENGNPPRGNQFDLDELREIAGHVYLVEVLPDGTFYATVSGDDVNFIFGRNFVGHIVQKGDVDSYGHNLEAYYSQIAQTRLGRRCRGTLTFSGRRSDQFESIDCPLVNDAGSVVRIAGAIEVIGGIEAVRLAENEQFLRSVLDRSSVGISITARSGPRAGQRLYQNRRHLELLGLRTAEESLFLPPAESFRDPADFTRINELLESQGYVHGYEAERLRADGNSWWCLIDLQPVRFENTPCDIAWIIDITDRRKLEEERDRQRVLLQEAKAEAERAKLEAKMIQSQKMEAIGTLASGIAHDFNNLLGGILGYTELAKSTPAGSAEQQRHLESARNTIFMARSFAHKILAFSRESSRERKPTSLQGVIREAIDVVQASVPSQITITYREQDDVLSKANVTEIQQVLINLLTNAWHAMPAGGAISIALDSIAVASELVVDTGRIPPGRYARIVVNDSGTGIEESIRQRLFDPFFTTKPVGQGTGLGLSIVRRIAIDHGGGVALASIVGQGTTFTLYLPEVEGSAGGTDAPPQFRRGQGERILLVDDDDNLRNSATELLKGVGYRVTAVQSPEMALKLFRTDPSAIDIVITDYLMPNIDGLNLAKMMRESRPDIPVLILSGNVRSLPAQEMAAMSPALAVLSKPLSITELASEIARSLKPV